MFSTMDNIQNAQLEVQYIIEAKRVEDQDWEKFAAEFNLKPISVYQMVKKALKRR